MKISSIFRRAGIVIAACAFSLPAFATWDGEVIATGTSLRDLQSSTISFETNGRQLPVEVRKNRDGKIVFVIGFTGNAATAGVLSINGPTGDKTIRTPAASPGQNIYVDTTGPGSASTLRPAQPVNVPTGVYFPTHQVSLDLGWRNLQGGDIATAGTTIPASGPGNEFPTLAANYDIDAVGGSISYAYNTGGSLPAWIDRTGFSSNLTVGLSYGSYSDDEDSRFVTDELADRGFLNTTLPAAPNDFTGPFFGPTAAQSFANIDVDLDRFNAFMEWLCNRPLPGDSFFKSRVDFGYTQWDVDIESLDTFDPPFPEATYFNRRVQSVEQDIFDFGLGTTIITPLGKGWDVYGGGMLRVYYSDADLSSTESFQLGSPPDEVRRVDQSDDEWDIGVDVTVGAGYHFGSNWRVSAEATVGFNVPSASIDNPVSGDGSNPGPDEIARTRINYDNETLWSLGLDVRYAF